VFVDARVRGHHHELTAHARQALRVISICGGLSDLQTTFIDVLFRKKLTATPADSGPIRRYEPRRRG